MGLDITGRDLETVIAGGAGTFVGVTFGEFVSNFVANLFKLEGNVKTVAKGIVKFIVGLLFWVFSGRFLGPVSLFFETIGYGSIASIGTDIVAMVYPGGLTGLIASLGVKGGKSSVTVKEKTSSVSSQSTPQKASIGGVRV